MVHTSPRPIIPHWMDGGGLAKRAEAVVVFIRLLLMFFWRIDGENAAAIEMMLPRRRRKIAIWRRRRCCNNDGLLLRAAAVAFFMVDSYGCGKGGFYLSEAVANLCKWDSRLLGSCEKVTQDTVKERSSSISVEDTYAGGCATYDSSSGAPP